jgi:hypothetical protein
VDGFSRASSTAAATNTSATFGIYRWGFSTSQGFNGDIALIAWIAAGQCLDLGAVGRGSADTSSVANPLVSDRMLHGCPRS